MNKTPNQKTKLQIVIMEPLGISDDALKTLTMLLKADGHQIIAYDRKAESEEILTKRVKDANIIVLAMPSIKDGRCGIYWDRPYRC